MLYQGQGVASLIICGLCLLVSATASARVIRNDDITENAEISAKAVEIIAGEMVAATFTVDPSELPETIVGFSWIMVAGPKTKAPEIDCGQFHLIVYGEANGKLTELFNTEKLDEQPTIEIASSSSQEQQWRLSNVQGHPIKWTEGSIRVVLKAVVAKCLFHDNISGRFPVLAVDSAIQDGKNWIFGSAGNGPGQWFDASRLSVSGDFALRVITEKSEPTTGTDTTTNGGQATSTTFSVDNVSPAFGYDDEQTIVSLVGKGFDAGMTVKLGATSVTVKEVTGSSLATIVVPSGMAVGTYTVIVVNTEQKTASKVGAFEIKKRSTTADGANTTNDGSSNTDGSTASGKNASRTSSGCGVSTTQDSSALGLLALFGLLMFGWRRRLDRGCR